MDADGVLGIQYLVLSATAGTAYLLNGSITIAAFAGVFGLIATWYLTRSVVRHANWHAGGCLVASDWDTAKHAGVSVVTLGTLGFVQWELGFLHRSIALVILFLGASLVIAGVVESPGRSEVEA